MNKIGFRQSLICGCCLLAGWLAACSTDPETPPLEVSPVSVGAPPDHTISNSTAKPIGNCKGGVCENCICPGDGRCERQECDQKEPALVIQPAAIAKAVEPEPVYTQPYTPPAPKPVAVQQSYSSCANGSCGSSSRGRFRIFGRRR